MRDDMKKVVVERPRHGHRLCYHDVRDRTRLDVRSDPDGDHLPPVQESMRRRHIVKRTEKHLTDFLSPLQGYLRTSVGRPWSEVWSEICANLKAGSTMQDHVREHVHDFVLARTWRLPDGRIAGAIGKKRRRLAVRIPGEGSWWPDFIVCPETGLLMLASDLPQVNEAVANARNEARLKRRNREKIRPVRVDADTELRLIGGVWHVVTYADLPRSKETHRVATLLSETQLRIDRRRYPKEAGFVFEAVGDGTWRVLESRYSACFDVVLRSDVRYGEPLTHRMWGGDEERDMPIWGKVRDTNGISHRTIRVRYAAAKKQADSRLLRRFGLTNQDVDKPMGAKGLGRFIRSARLRERDAKRKQAERKTQEGHEQ